MSNRSQAFTLLLARIFLALPFLTGGAAKAMSWSHTMQDMAFRGVPFSGVFLAGAIALQIGGGLCLVAGWRARVAAWALVAFLVPATLLFHNFWAMTADVQREHLTQFLKNLSILGGLLVVAVNGAGAWSVDARTGDRGS